MGAWGGGLYDSDFARDLKATIAVVLRTPLSDDELLAEIWDSHGKGAAEGDALDYWLVLADQLERHGIHRKDAFDRAAAIVKSGEDVDTLKALDADAKTIGRRQVETKELLQRLRDPRAPKPRRPLKKPQPLLLEPGEALIWPTDHGNSINPYVSEDKLGKLGGFTPNGWGFAVVTDAGHHFRVLAYYAVQVLKWRRRGRPSPALAVHCPRSAHHYGTISALHLKRARVERLGLVPVEALGPPPTADVARRSSRRAVLLDIGLSAAFGLDAWNTWVGPEVKFPFPAPSGKPLDPKEPDQRSDPGDAA